MKMALIHDWLLTEGGAEKVLESFQTVFDKSPIYTLFYDEKRMENSFFSSSTVHSSVLQKIPFSRHFYRYLLPLFPWAIERFDLTSYEVILSGSHAVAKGVITREDQLHICYCYNPMRYVWDFQEEYLSSFQPLLGRIARKLFERVRLWDYENSKKVDLFVTSSFHVAKRIEKAYQRKALVIHPPVSVEDFFLSNQREEYYVTHSRFVPYKRVDLLVEAFGRMPDKKLVVIGDGPEEAKIRKMAKKNIELLGYVTREELAKIFSKAKAYVFGAEEDFGIGVIEAQSAGLPVIAFGKGGSLETVIEGKTGLFFAEPTALSLIEAIQLFEKKEGLFDPLLIRKHAERFNRQRFELEIKELVGTAKENFYEGHYSRRG